jgi:hypothetical protein
MKTIADLFFGDKVVAKDKSYGIGTLVGTYKDYKLIGYKLGNIRHSACWSCRSYQFINDTVVADNIREFDWFIYAPNTLEVEDNDNEKEVQTQNNYAQNNYKVN